LFIQQDQWELLHHHLRFNAMMNPRTRLVSVDIPLSNSV